MIPFPKLEIKDQMDKDNDGNERNKNKRTPKLKTELVREYSAIFLMQRT